MNMDTIARQAERLHRTAKDGLLMFEGLTYTLTFNHYQGHYVVKGEDSFELALNTRKITQAKKMLKEYLAN